MLVKIDDLIVDLDRFFNLRPLFGQYERFLELKMFFVEIVGVNKERVGDFVVFAEKGEGLGADQSVIAVENEGDLVVLAVVVDGLVNVMEGVLSFVVLDKCPLGAVDNELSDCSLASWKT